MKYSVYELHYSWMNEVCDNFLCIGVEFYFSWWYPKKISMRPLHSLLFVYWSEEGKLDWWGSRSQSWDLVFLGWGVAAIRVTRAPQFIASIENQHPPHYRWGMTLIGMCLIAGKHGSWVCSSWEMIVQANSYNKARLPCL